MTNRKIILVTFLLSVASISFYTFYKVQKNHLDLSILVTERRITEGAKQCVWDDVCKENQITLEELIRLGYAKEEVNPYTKMYYKKSSYVEKKENTYTFIEVN